MQKIFLDTNILLDVLLDRGSFCPPAQVLWTLAERKKIQGFISAISVNNVFFIVYKLSSSEKAHKAVGALLDIFRVVEVTKKLLVKAHQMHWPDFEDAIQYQAALRSRVKFLVSRDAEEFAQGVIPVVDAAQYLAHPDNQVLVG